MNHHAKYNAGRSRGSRWIVGVVHLGAGVFQIQARATETALAHAHADLCFEFMALAEAGEIESVYRESEDEVADILEALLFRMAAVAVPREALVCGV